MDKLRVLAVSCGNGVILHPFLDSKVFEVVAGIESRPIYRTPDNIQWKLNFGDIPLFNSLSDFLKFNKGRKIDVLVAAPDCGHSSVLALSRAKKFSKGSENDSIKQFIEAFSVLKPTYFLFENLPAFIKNDKSDFLSIFRPNYSMMTYSGPVTRFGNSQKSRKRLIIAGKLGNTCPFKLPKPGKYALLNVRDLEKGLKEENIELGHVREDDNTIITMFGGYKISLKHARKRWITELEGKKRWPTGENRMKNAPGVYRNLPTDLPLTVRKGNREFNSRGYMMSPRERARIMGIPDTFKIWFDPSRKTTCINKGRITVTKTVPYQVITWFKKSVRNDNLGT